MKLQLIRHATQVLEYGGQRILIDPMLAAPGVLPSLTLGSSYGRNPRVPLPVLPEILTQVDAVLLTHTHFDHWDRAAQRLLPRSLPIYCQPADAKGLTALGFTDLRVMTTQGLDCVGGLRLRIFPGSHGTGLVGALMGASAGFVFQQAGEPVLCLTGDTVWCPELARVLSEARPRVVVLYAGAAQFNLGAPITLDAAAVECIALAVPQAELVAVHMDAINHCRLTRAALSAYAQSKPWRARLRIPRDGECCAFH